MVFCVASYSQYVIQQRKCKAERQRKTSMSPRSSYLSSLFFRWRLDRNWVLSLNEDAIENIETISQQKVLVLPFFILNRPFPSSLVPLFQNESKCETFHMKMSSACSFIFMQIKIIFIRMVSQLNSLWNRGTRELGNGLLTTFWGSWSWLWRQVRSRPNPPFKLGVFLLIRVMADGLEKKLLQSNLSDFS